MASTANTEILPCFVGGEPRTARSGETLEATNPATGDVIARFPRCGADVDDDAVQAGRRAFLDWRETPAIERAAMVRSLADAVESHAEELASLDVRENGSLIREIGDAQFAAAALRYTRCRSPSASSGASSRPITR
jgi:betaine-aldehyde dehydrogenase